MHRNRRERILSQTCKTTVIIGAESYTKRTGSASRLSPNQEEVRSFIKHDYPKIFSLEAFFTNLEISRKLYLV